MVTRYCTQHEQSHKIKVKVGGTNKVKDVQKKKKKTEGTVHSDILKFRVEKQLNIFFTCSLTLPLATKTIGYMYTIYGY